MTKNAIKFSIISPVYGAAKLLPELVRRIHDSVSGITNQYEIILVEDNSRDDSWEIIKQLAAEDDKIVGISLSRNFGQQPALNAGFDAADGDWIVTLDCDLQDEPERIIDLYQEALKGYDIVFASRVERKDGWLKIVASKLFYKILGYLTETEQDHSIANFVLYKKSVVDSMASLGDYHKYYPMLNKWVGFKTIKLPIKHAARKDNKKSSYSYKKRLKLAFSTIVAFSDKPLRLVLKLGISLVSLS
ncbi:MAG: glycosyltransferase family 2 protein, partial [Bacteroidales bacterium]|nr:glycosyltransferase family 2 protein [Bacteroidales bacterium]